MKGIFSEILEKYRLKRRYTINFRKFKLSYVFFITVILQQIFQNFTKMLRKSQKLKKRKLLCRGPYHITPPPPIRHNGNMSACEWKTSHLRHTATVSIIAPTALPSAPLHTIHSHCIFHYTPVF